MSEQVNRLNAKLLRAEGRVRELEGAKALEPALMLSVFILEFRKQLVEYRKTGSVDVLTPGQLLDVLIWSIDEALEQTKGKP